MLEIRQLRHFVAVAEAGGIRKAGRRIHLSPSSLTRSIQILEEHFNTSLMEYEDGVTHLTPFGRQFLEDARTVVAGVDAMVPNLEQLGKLSTGHLRVGLSPAVANMLLPQVSARLMRDFPHVSIESRLYTASEIVELLRDREIDLGIAHARSLRLEEACQVEHLYHDKGCWLVRRGHPILKKNRGSLLDFARYPLIMQHLPSLYQEWLKSIELAVSGAKTGATVRVAHTSSDYDLLYRMTLDSDAIMATPEKTAFNSAYAKKLRRIHLPMGPPAVEFATAHLRVPRPSPLALKFVQYMQEEMAPLAGACEATG